jgi:hypothetical protein
MRHETVFWSQEGVGVSLHCLALAVSSAAVQHCNLDEVPEDYFLSRSCSEAPE